MGFLEDAGRGNAFAPINNVMGRAIELRQLSNQEDNQALGRAIDIEKLGIMKQEATRENTKFKWAAEDQARKAAIRDTPAPITALFGPGWEKDPAKKMQFDKMKEKGLVNEVAPGVIMTTVGNALALKEYAAKDLEWTKQVSEQNLITTNNQLTEIDTALTEEKNPKKIEELNQQKAVVTKKLSDLTAAHQRIDFKHKNEMELAKAKQTGKIQKGPGGALYQQDEQGNMVELVPPQEKEQWVDEPRNVQGKQVEGQRNKVTNEWKARAQGQNISINMPSQEETSNIVQMIHDNGLDPSQVPKRGGTWNKVMSDWKKAYPQENINDYSAFAKWKRDTSVNKSMTLLDSIEPMLVKMERLHKELGLSNFTDVNKMKVWMKQHTGDPKVAEYETYMRNVVQELPPAMTGYFPTDTRITMELKNLETAKSPAQIGASIGAVRDLVRVRRQQFFAPSWSPLMKNQTKQEVKRLTYNPTTGQLE